MEALVIIGAAIGAFATQVGRLTKGEQSQTIAAVGSMLWAGFLVIAFLMTGWQHGLLTVSVSIVSSLASVAAITIARTQQ